jgi:hypothetical protein
MTASKKGLSMIDLKSMAVAMPEVVGHPNRAAFQGVLTTVDVPSQRAPSGAKGHLVVLTRRAAEEALPSLLGMALDYSPTLDRHDVRRKVGVITRAEILGRSLEVGGYLFARDFPEIVQEIGKSQRGGRSSSIECSAIRACEGWTVCAANAQSRWGEIHSFGAHLRESAVEMFRFASAMRPNKNFGPTIRAEAVMAMQGLGGLGLSYEVTGVQLANARAQVWMLEKVTFTGAAILRRNKAAYPDTWIELS